MIQQTIGEIVAKNIHYADVFQKNGIDFCCKGNVLLKDAVEKKGIDLNSILKELQAIDSKPSLDRDYDGMSLVDLITIIESSFHQYIRKETPDMLFLLKKIKAVHGHNHPELSKVYDLFSESTEDLSHHMYKEENVLFPFIKELEQTNGESKASFGSVQNPISVLMEEHVHEGGIFEEINTLTNQYNPPADACNTYKLAFHKLKEFEEMLHKHIHLENNILFPKALVKEKQKAH